MIKVNMIKELTDSRNNIILIFTGRKRFRC